jgi:hypothetical protein
VGINMFGRTGLDTIFALPFQKRGSSLNARVDFDFEKKASNKPINSLMVY